MKPIYFSSEGNSVLGVYHPAEKTGVRSSANAVVLCPPFGQEAIRSHKCLLSLAKRLAKNGTHVLRFAYRGTDDSSLASDEIYSLKDWQTDIVSAKEYLKRLSGCETVMLAGLRLGANLAVKVASESDDVHSVVLWEPIEDGSAYLERLRANQYEMIDLWHTPIAPIDTEETEELFSTRYQRSLLSDLEQVRLDTLGLHQPTFIVSACNRSEASHQEPELPSPSEVFRDEMEMRAESVEPDGWQELEQLEEVWWRPQSVHQVATAIQETFNRIETYGWHHQHAVARQNRFHSYSDFAQVELTPACPVPEEVSTVRESVCQFGAECTLTGILMEPKQRVEDAPVVILLNAGIVHRIGPFRLHVQLARILAKCGFASLRLDLSGLGDSSPRTGKQSKDERVRHDVTEAMEYLQNKGIGSRFVLFGLCSGGYHAHQIAVADPRVVGAVFLDGIVFRTLGYYFRHQFLRLFRPRFWRNAIKRRWLKANRKFENSFTEEGKGLAEAEFFHVDQSRQQVSKELLDLRGRNAQLLFVYTGDYDDVCGRSQFREMYGIQPDEQTQVDYFADSSHTFRIAKHRDQLCIRIAKWMQDRFRL